MSFLDDIPPVILKIWGGREAILAARTQGEQTKARLRELLPRCARGISKTAQTAVTGIQYHGYRRTGDPEAGTETHTELWQLSGTLHLPEATYQVTITGPYSPLPPRASLPDTSEQARQLARAAGACS